jgi:protein-L-isoaspartate(D-aspartate) O-methyltransferase
MFVPAPFEASAEASREAVEAASFVLTLRARGVRDTAVLGAMERVRRELFAPRRFSDLARTDVSLPLPYGQTMTAPSTVATMLIALNLQAGHRVLEIGTGSGYVTALLARIGGRLTSIERYAPLAEEAQTRLEVAGIEPPDPIDLVIGDGLDLKTSEERFDRVLVNGALPSIPSTVTSALASGGRLVGALTIDGFPRLITIERTQDGALVHMLGGGLRLSPLASAGASPVSRFENWRTKPNRAVSATVA